MPMRTVTPGRCLAEGRDGPSRTVSSIIAWSGIVTAHGEMSGGTPFTEHLQWATGSDSRQAHNRVIESPGRRAERRYDEMADPFQDRAEAGRTLALFLAPYVNRADVVVLALPRGGVPVAREIAA